MFLATRASDLEYEAAAILASGRLATNGSSRVYRRTGAA
jgi:hypothetical protein